jgi:hypothetical protein
MWTCEQDKRHDFTGDGTRKGAVFASPLGDFRRSTPGGAAYFSGDLR